jgi:hypothetical protein
LAHAKGVDTYCARHDSWAVMGSAVKLRGLLAIGMILAPGWPDILAFVLALAARIALAAPAAAPCGRACARHCRPARKPPSALPSLSRRRER